MLSSMAHHWYSWVRKACPDRPFLLWYSAAYYYEAMETGVCTGRLEHVCHRERPSRPCMAVARPNRELRKGGFFFSRAANCLFFRKTSNREHLAGPARSCCQAQSVRAAVVESFVCETTVKMWQGLPPGKGLAVESPCGGERPGKEEEELLQWFPRGWLVIDEPFLVGGLVLWP